MYFTYAWDDLKNSPTMQDKLFCNWTHELDLREKLCVFIQTVGKKIQVYHKSLFIISIVYRPQVVISAACVYFHLFYTKHSFSDHDGHVDFK